MSDRLPVKDVVVLLPGIMGSVLRRDGRDVWAVTPGAVLRGVLSLGRDVRGLRLDGDDADGVTAHRLMPDVHLVPGLWKIDGYGAIKQTLTETFTLDENANWFDFPYDWRRDNRVAAHALAQRAAGWLAAWRERSGARDAKLILLAHSMGGLVARYYLEELDGWKDTRALVTFGTPYRGSLNALDYLANGFSKGVGPFKLDLADLLRSLPSVYQLLPTYPCVEDGSGQWRKVADAAGLPAAVDLARVKAAAEFHGEIATAVERNGGYGRYAIHPVVGILQPTLQSALVRAGTVEVLGRHGDDDDGGDGTVPRVSATPLELSDDPREVYATEAHASLQHVAPVIDHVKGVLTRRSLAAFKGTAFDGFRLAIDDQLPPGEPIAVAAETAGPAIRARFRLTNADTGETAERIAELVDGQATANLPPVPAGVYRITVSDPDRAVPHTVTDLVLVADDATAERLAED